MTPLKIYNSLSKSTEIFTPLQAGKVGMYVCGMTVYDYCHLGHARVMVFFDVVARHLRALGYELTYVRNITDVDDKIINRAAAEGKSLREITDFYIRAMHEDEAALLCQRPDLEPRATEALPAMQALIADLLAKGHAYQTPAGDVYFSVASFPGYGKLSHQSIEQLVQNTRVEFNDQKRDQLDFALWKRAGADEPAWPSPWGDGRPGWHLECSAMSRASLGERFDIHGGGLDLKFPHHECEIAQSEGSCGHQTVNYWLHNNFVTIDGVKMSKSLGNYHTIRDLLRDHDGELIRLLVLMTNYRGMLDYSAEGLANAKKARQRLYAALAKGPATGPLDAAAEADFINAMNDDFNTTRALAVLFELSRRINGGETTLAPTLRALGGRLGLLQRDPAEVLTVAAGADSVSAEEIEALIAERQAAKAARDFGRADAIRAGLLARGVILKDTAGGTEWSYQE